MAIKVPGNMDSLSLTVTLRDGTVIGPADTTNQPFGGSERVVAVWQGAALVMYPIDLVAKVEMHFASQPPVDISPTKPRSGVGLGELLGVKG